MRFLSCCLALVLALTAIPSALAQKKASKPPPKPAVHKSAPKPPPKPAVHKPAPKPTPKPAVHKPAPKPPPKPAAHKPPPKPAAQKSAAGTQSKSAAAKSKPRPKPDQKQAKKPAARPPSATTAQRRQAEQARAEALMRAGHLPQSVRPSGARNPASAWSAQTATPSRLIPSAGKLITPTIGGLAAAPLIQQTPTPALNGLARAPRITPTVRKTDSMMVQNSRKEIVVVRRSSGPRYYSGRGYGTRGRRYRSGYYGNRSYARFRRPYRNPNATSQALTMQRLEQLRADLDRIRQSRAVASESLRTQLGSDLLAIAPGKPSTAETQAVRQLADDLAEGLRGRPGAIPPTSALVLSLNQVMNHRRMAPDALASSIQDGRAALMAWRVPLARVARIVHDLEAVEGNAPVASAARVP